jgi:hypothetical protein
MLPRNYLCCLSYRRGAAEFFKIKILLSFFYTLICLNVKEKALVSNTNKSTPSSSSSASDDNESLDVDHDQAPLSMQAHRVNCHLAKRVYVLIDMYILGSTLLNGGPATQNKFVFLSNTIKK